MNLDDVAASVNLIDRRNDPKSFHWMAERDPNPRGVAVPGLAYREAEPPQGLGPPSQEELIRAITAERAGPQEQYEETPFSIGQVPSDMWNAIKRVPSGIARDIRSHWY